MKLNLNVDCAECGAETKVGVDLSDNAGLTTAIDELRPLHRENCPAKNPSWPDVAIATLHITVRHEHSVEVLTAV
jgi:hypothetical protein